MIIGFYCNWSVKPSKEGFYIASIHKAYLDAFKKKSPYFPLILVSNTSPEAINSSDFFVPYSEVMLIPLPAFRNYIKAIFAFLEILKALWMLSRQAEFIYIKTFEPFSWFLALIKRKENVLNYHFVANPFEAIWGKESDSVFTKLFKSALFYPEFHFTCLAAFNNRATGNGPSVRDRIPAYLKLRMKIVIESSLSRNDFLFTDKSIDPKCFRILTVAALKSAKGHKYLFEGLEIFRKKYPGLNIELKVVGDGEDKDEILESSINCNITGVTYFSGHLNGAALKATYEEAEVFILTSLAETGPRVILEAMAMKDFVICTDVGYAREVMSVNGIIQGKLIKPRSAQDVVNSLEWYKNNKEEASRMVQNAFERSQSFTLEGFVENLIY